VSEKGKGYSRELKTEGDSDEDVRQKPGGGSAKKGVIHGMSSIGPESNPPTNIRGRGANHKDSDLAGVPGVCALYARIDKAETIRKEILTREMEDVSERDLENRRRPTI